MDLRESGVVLEDLRKENASKESLHFMGSVSDKHSMAGGFGATEQSRKKKVVMHVNQFVPFYMQYHQLGAKQIEELYADYSKKELSGIKG